MTGLEKGDKKGPDQIFPGFSGLQIHTIRHNAFDFDAFYRKTRTEGQALSRLAARSNEG